VEIFPAGASDQTHTVNSELPRNSDFRKIESTTAAVAPPTFLTLTVTGEGKCLRGGTFGEKKE